MSTEIRISYIKFLLFTFRVLILWEKETFRKHATTSIILSLLWLGLIYSEEIPTGLPNSGRMKKIQLQRPTNDYTGLTLNACNNHRAQMNIRFFFSLVIWKQIMSKKITKDDKKQMHREVQINPREQTPTTQQGKRRVLSMRRKVIYFFKFSYKIQVEKTKIIFTSYFLSFKFNYRIQVEKACQTTTFPNLKLKLNRPHKKGYFQE